MHTIKYCQNWIKTNRINVFLRIRECSSWASKNGAVQISFLTPSKKIFAGKFVK